MRTIRPTLGVNIHKYIGIFFMSLSAKQLAKFGDKFNRRNYLPSTESVEMVMLG